MKINLEYKNNWLEFYGKKITHSSFRIGLSSYYDDRLYINTSITTIFAVIGILLSGFSLYSLIFLPFFVKSWGELYIHIPIHSGIDSSEPPQYGFYFYSDVDFIPSSFWLCLGDKVKRFRFPWELEWYRTSTLKQDNSYYIESKGNRLDLWEIDKYPDVKYESFPYKYTLKSGKIQNVIATVSVSEREWRPLWFTWTSLFSYIRKSINIEFSDEVGERAGSWKGGTVGCSYELIQNETVLECLRRMESERKF